MSELNFYLSRTIGHRFWHALTIPDRVCAGMKPYRIELLFTVTHKCGDFEAFSVAPIPRDGGTSLQEANGGVPLDGVAFSIELLECGRTFSDIF